MTNKSYLKHVNKSYEIDLCNKATKLREKRSNLHV